MSGGYNPGDAGLSSLFRRLAAQLLAKPLAHAPRSGRISEHSRRGHRVGGVWVLNSLEQDCARGERCPSFNCPSVRASPTGLATVTAEVRKEASESLSSGGTKVQEGRPSGNLVLVKPLGLIEPQGHTPLYSNQGTSSVMNAGPSSLGGGRSLSC